MAPCVYKYKNKTYDKDDFIKLLLNMKPFEASKHMPGVQSVPNAPFIGKTKKSCIDLTQPEEASLHFVHKSIYCMVSVSASNKGKDSSKDFPLVKIAKFLSRAIAHKIDSAGTKK